MQECLHLAGGSSVTPLTYTYHTCAGENIYLFRFHLLQVFINNLTEIVGAAWPRGLKCRFYGDIDRNHMILVNHPPSSRTLLHPSIRHFTMIISAWWL